MERIKTRGEDGKQNPDYYKSYYTKNKERIARINKERYQRVRSDPVLLQEHRERCAEATRRYRQRHPERVFVNEKVNRLNRKKRAFEKLGGAFCVNCGCDIIEFLEFNHRNGGGCKEIRTLGNRMIDMVLNGQRGGEDYEVLCRVCNALDHLKRKNPDKAQGFKITFTGKEAERLE